LSAGASRVAEPLSTAIYTHMLTNTGRLSGTFTIKAASAHHWPVALLEGNQPVETLPVSLAAGLTTTLRISVSVPAVMPGYLDAIVLTATSALSPSIFIAVTDEVRVVAHIYPSVIRRQ
jgi:hypothetical protein